MQRHNIQPQELLGSVTVNLPRRVVKGEDN